LCGGDHVAAIIEYNGPGRRGTLIKSEKMGHVTTDGKRANLETAGEQRLV
jgi:hypothetical protein